MSIFLQILFTILTLGSLYTLVTVGFSLIYAVCGVLHVAQGVVVVEAAYVFLGLVKRGLHPLAAAAVAVSAVVVTGLLMNVAVFERLRRQGKVSPVGALIASVALLMMGTNILLLVFGPATQTTGVTDNAPRWVLGGATLNAVDLGTVAAAVAVVAAVGWLYRRTKIGTSLRAVADNAAMAEVVGIDTRRVRHLAFAVGSALAGIAGILFAVKFSLEPNQSVLIGIKAFSRAVIGGVGSIPGAILGNVIIETAENVSAFYTHNAFKEVFSFLAVFGFLLFRPHGITGGRRS